MAMKLMYITNDISVAKIAQKYGVDRIWVDLEIEGKEERQRNQDSVKSHHTVEDVARLSGVVEGAELMVRINPWSERSSAEIERVIEAGADRIMLPMWKTPEEVSAFLNAVAGRVKTTLLLETKEAAACVDEVLTMGGFDEIHIGLNDLHLSYGLTFMFQLLTNGTVEMLCRKFKDYGIPYGFGGIAKIGGGLLPAENILLEHHRLGSTRAILSRSFCDVEKETNIEKIFAQRLQEVRDFEAKLPAMTEQALCENKTIVEQKVGQIVALIQSKRG